VYEDDHVVVEISNRGGAGANGDAGGSGAGIVGMRERALALGGEFTAGRREDGGFRVRASLPLAPDP
jgi:signal transduction histidine kinase